MKIEVGKVYECGYAYVYIDYRSTALSKEGMYPFVGIRCNKDGVIGQGRTSIGRFSDIGEDAAENPEGLKATLKEISKRETVTIGSSVYYKDEFEAATKHLREVKQ